MRMLQPEIVISFEEVDFNYGEKKVLEGVNLDVYSKDFVTVVGPNGAGKTTLIKLILGLLKPSRGKVTVFGKSPEKCRGKIGYVPQSNTLDDRFPITVEEVIASGILKPFGHISRKRRKRILEISEELGISHLMERHVFSLSGGEFQRVLLARALISSPPIVILDEPVANIDSEGEEVVADFLTRLKGEKTIIVVTHDTGFVSELTTRTICVNNRKVREHEVSPNEVLATIFGHGRCDKRVVHGR